MLCGLFKKDLNPIDLQSVQGPRQLPGPLANPSRPPVFDEEIPVDAGEITAERDISRQELYPLSKGFDRASPRVILQVISPQENHMPEIRPHRHARPVKVYDSAGSVLSQPVQVRRVGILQRRFPVKARTGPISKPVCNCQKNFILHNKSSFPVKHSAFQSFQISTEQLSKDSVG